MKIVTHRIMEEACNRNRDLKKLSDKITELYSTGFTLLSHTTVAGQYNRCLDDYEAKTLIHTLVFLKKEESK